MKLVDERDVGRAKDVFGYLDSSGAETGTIFDHKRLIYSTRYLERGGIAGAGDPAGSSTTARRVGVGGDGVGGVLDVGQFC